MSFFFLRAYCFFSDIKLDFWIRVFLLVSGFFSVPQKIKKTILAQQSGDPEIGLLLTRGHYIFSKVNLDLEIDSSFSKSISSKDKQGNPKTFNMNVLIVLKYIENSDVKRETSFSENTTYNNQDDKFSLKNYEDSLKENLTDKIIDNILIYLQSTSSNASNAKLTGNIGFTKSTNDN